MVLLKNQPLSAKAIAIKKLFSALFLTSRIATLVLLLSPGIRQLAAASVESIPESRPNEFSRQDAAKKVFEKYGVTVRGVLRGARTLFTVAMPFDPQSSENSKKLNKLCLEVLEANAWRNYSLKIISDSIQIDITWNDTREQMSMEIIPIK